MFISFICIIIIILGIIVYFLGQTSSDRYGDRLDGINKVKIKSERQKEIESKIEENELVKSASIDIRGKLIYINIVINTGKHADVEALGMSSLEIFSEKEKGFYDIQYIVSNEDKNIEENFPIMGYIKSGNSVIKWTNYVQ